MHRALELVAALLLVGAVLSFATRAPRALARAVWLGTFTILVGGAAAMATTGAFAMRWGYRGDSPQSGLLRSIDATCERPFVYRRLAPDLVGWATDWTLTHVSSDRLAAVLKKSEIKVYVRDPAEEWSTRKIVAFHFAHWFSCVSWFCAVVAGALLLHEIKGWSPAASVSAAALGVALIPLTFVGGGYLYDPPELALWTLVLFLAARGSLVGATGAFALMCVNKESALLAVPALVPLFFRRVGVRRGISWALLFTAMAFSWQLYVRAKYADLPGDTMAQLLSLNLTFFSQPKNYLLFAQLYGPGLLAPRGVNVLILVMLCLTFRFGWSALRDDFRTGLMLELSILMPLFLIAGSADETRALALLFPFLLLLGTNTVERLASVNERERVPARELDAQGLTTPPPERYPATPTWSSGARSGPRSARN